MRHTLKTLGHPQPHTPIQTDNSTAKGILNTSIKQKWSQAIDMGYYWLQDCIQLQQFMVHWKPGIANYTNYFTKHHPEKYHIEHCHLYLKHEPP
jgi:hypothetical protein